MPLTTRSALPAFIAAALTVGPIPDVFAQQKQEHMENPQTNGKEGAKVLLDSDEDRATEPRLEQQKNRESWRYVRHNGERWYWMPEKYWLYYRNGQWHRYDPRTFVRPGPRISSDSFANERFRAAEKEEHRRYRRHYRRHFQRRALGPSFFDEFIQSPPGAPRIPPGLGP